MSNLMMQSFPEFPSITRTPLPQEVSLERRVQTLEGFLTRLELGVSQKFFVMEGEIADLKEQLEVARQQNLALVDGQMRMDKRVEIIRRNVCEINRKQAELNGEIIEINEDAKVRDNAIDSFRKLSKELLENCRSIENGLQVVSIDVRETKQETKFMTENMTKKAKDDAMVLTQDYLKNKGYDNLFFGTMDRMNDLENAVKNVKCSIFTQIEQLDKKIEMNASLSNHEIRSFDDSGISKNEAGEADEAGEAGEAGEDDEAWADWSNYYKEERAEEMKEWFEDHLLNKEWAKDYKEWVEDLAQDDVWGVNYQADIKQISEPNDLPIAPSLSDHIYSEQFPSL